MSVFTARTAAVLALAAAGLSASSLPTPASAAPLARPDLQITAGAVGDSNSGPAGFTGQFTVKNTGSGVARSSTAALRLTDSAGRSRTLKRFAVPALRAGQSRTVQVAVRDGATSGDLIAVADLTNLVREKSEYNNTRQVGEVGYSAGLMPPDPGSEPGMPQGAGPAQTPAASGSSVPSAPANVVKETIVKPSTGAVPYWAYVSSTYDASHQTPTPLFVWMHGCGGEAEGDVNVIAPYSGENYIAMSIGGRDGQCWDMNSDPAKVLSAIADIKTHFNIDPRRITLGGYSSGGDLAYRTAFDNASMFAGVLAENSSPFRDTGLTQQQAIARAGSKFHVVHLAHLQDDTYPIAGVRQETDALKNAGFDVTRVERQGTHYDDSSAEAGTDRDVQKFLLPHLADGWTSAS